MPTSTRSSSEAQESRPVPIFPGKFRRVPAHRGGIGAYDAAVRATASLRERVSKMRFGDRLVFTYSGHGSWVVPQGALMTWAVMMEGGETWLRY